ncbi:MAG: hypothetical protein ACKVP7_25725, partial [Hyphomicrobiaceae bacterium]
MLQRRFGRGQREPRRNTACRPIAPYGGTSINHREKITLEGASKLIPGCGFSRILRLACPTGVVFARQIEARTGRGTRSHRIDHR